MFRISVLPAFVFGLLLTCALAGSVHAEQTVLFDQGHGQLFTIERNGDLDLSRFAALFKEAGYDVRTATSPLASDLLTGVDAMVLSGTFKNYSPEEIKTIVSFVERGGSLCIMLHIGPPVAQLLGRLGVDHSNGVIREQENTIDLDPINFKVTRLAKLQLFDGLQSFSLYGVWALNPIVPGVQSIAVTSGSAWIDLNRNNLRDPADAQLQFAVAVAGQLGSGRFVVFGDDAIFQNKFLVGDNLILGRNLAKWLSNNPATSFRPVSSR